MGLFSKQPDKVQATSTTEPGPTVKPYVEFGLGQAKQLYQQPGPDFFPGSTVTPFSPEQTEAQNATLARARAGNPLIGQSQHYISDVLSGKYLNTGNPNDDAVYKGMEAKIMPSVNTLFANAGRYGSDAGHASTLGTALGEAYAPYASANWNAERGRMGEAAAAAPGLAHEDYFDPSMIDAVGAQRQGLAGQELQDAIARWTFKQDQPQQKLQQYLANILGVVGSNQTSSEPYYQPSAWTQLAGLGISGLGTAASLGWQPFAAAA